jgi:site-specific recombinase XerC
MSTPANTGPLRVPWNKGRLTDQKPPLKLEEIWAIRVRLRLSSPVRDLAMVNLAIDSKLRARDLTKLRVRDVCHGEHVASRETIMQQKTQRPVQFEITEQTRDSVATWIRYAGLHATDFLFPSRIHDSAHLSTRQYARLVHRWIASIGPDDNAYGTHTMRRTKASLIYRRTKNLRAVQLLLVSVIRLAQENRRRLNGTLRKRKARFQMGAIHPDSVTT